MNQITIYATITDTTPDALTAILTETPLPGAPVQDLHQPLWAHQTGTRQRSEPVVDVRAAPRAASQCE
jgi:hypothetical protein